MIQSQMLTRRRWVQTANGDFAARAWGYPGKPPLTIGQSVAGVLQVVSFMAYLRRLLRVLTAKIDRRRDEGDDVREIRVLRWPDSSMVEARSPECWHSVLQGYRRR